jgi:hypothetical protein
VILGGILMLAVYGLIWGLFRCYGQVLFRPVTVVYSNHTMKFMSGRVTRLLVWFVGSGSCQTRLLNRVGWVDTNPTRKLELTSLMSCDSCLTRHIPIIRVMWHNYIKLQVRFVILK